jgi:uncharacterized Zn-finger protein
MCNKSFISSSNLKAHQRRHTANQQYSCDLCNMSFSKHNILKVHQRVCSR